jgi:hypothetical protein
MTNHIRSRLLITTLVLAAAILALTGSSAHATGAMRSKYGRTSTSSVALKTWERPKAGEPDTGSGSLPVPPKIGNAPQNLSGSDWSLRFYWSMRVMLNQLPRRF